MDARTTPKQHTSSPAPQSVRWRGVELNYCREDIRQPTAWTLHRDSHTLIVHQSGAMNGLETEIDGVRNRHSQPQRGDLWLVPGGLRYRSQAQGESIDYVLMHIDPAYLAIIAGEDTPVEITAPSRARPDAFLQSIVGRLVGTLGQNGQITALLQDHLLRTLCLHLLTEYGVRPEAPRREKAQEALTPKQAQRCRDYVLTHLSEPISLDRLAAELDMAVHHFLPAFHAAFGTTPLQYVIAQRLDHARALLLQSGMDITSIAVACGFSSHSHLTSTFRKHLGTTPSEFRTAFGQGRRGVTG